MAKMIFDEEGLLEEPCLSCDKAYIEDIWHEWCCDEKECPYETEREKLKTDWAERWCQSCGVKMLEPEEEIKEIWQENPEWYKNENTKFWSFC